MARARARASSAAAARNDRPGHRAGGDGGRLRVRRRDARALRNRGRHEPAVVPAGVFPEGLMNYLIHFLLAGDDDELRLGNLLGDHVKGRVERFDHPGLTDRLRTGIQMHRTIDAFSDRHPAVHRSKRILSAEYGKLSGVIVDLFYDHVLARRWAEHDPRPLVGFTQDVYRTLLSNRH